MIAAVVFATALRFVNIASATNAPFIECDGSDCSDSASLLQTMSRSMRRTRKLDVENAPENVEHFSENVENASENFDCHAALNEWERGWSQRKIRWCCNTQGIACGEMGAPHTQGELMQPQLELRDYVDITVVVNTATISEAGSGSGASMAFQVGPYWTEELDLCQDADVGAVVARKVRLPSWPNKMRIKALGNDSWGYTDVSAYFMDSHNTTSRIVVLDTFDRSFPNKSVSNEPYKAHTRYWVSTANGFPSENVYDVPTLPAEIGAATCITRDDPLSKTGFILVSPAGTQCVFGVDDADEGSHCIYDDGKYGSFGWCYTSKDGNTWGACSESCPLYGSFNILGAKLDEVLHRVDGLRQIVSPQSTSQIIKDDNKTGQIMNTTNASADQGTRVPPQ